MLRKGQRDELSFFVHADRDGLPGVEVRSCHERALHRRYRKWFTPWDRQRDVVMSRGIHHQAHLPRTERGRNDGFGPLQFLNGGPMTQSQLHSVAHCGADDLGQIRRTVAERAGQ